MVHARRVGPGHRERARTGAGGQQQLVVVHASDQYRSRCGARDGLIRVAVAPSCNSTSCSAYQAVGMHEDAGARSSRAGQIPLRQGRPFIGGVMALAADQHDPAVEALFAQRLGRFDRQPGRRRR